MSEEKQILDELLAHHRKFEKLLLKTSAQTRENIAAIQANPSLRPSFALSDMDWESAKKHNLEQADWDEQKGKEHQKFADFIATLTAEHDRLREERDELSRKINTICYDTEYRGGVQFWQQQAHEAMMAGLKIAQSADKALKEHATLRGLLERAKESADRLIKLLRSNPAPTFSNYSHLSDLQLQGWVEHGDFRMKQTGEWELKVRTAIKEHPKLASEIESTLEK